MKKPQDKATLGMAIQSIYRAFISIAGAVETAADTTAETAGVANDLVKVGRTQSKSFLKTTKIATKMSHEDAMEELKKRQRKRAEKAAARELKKAQELLDKQTQPE